MFDELPEFAVQGERGIDLFVRLDDPGQRRAQFRCIATLVEGPAGLIDHAPDERRDLAALTALAQRLASDPLAQPLSLTDATGWQGLTALNDPIRAFLLLDFLRAWLVADLAASRFQAALGASAQSLTLEPGKLAGAIAPLFDFNRLTRAQAVAGLLLPLLEPRIASPGFRDDGSGSIGYALRMLGDLCLRAANPALALRCFEAAVGAGDNPFRRRRAIEAARVAANREAATRHRSAYAARWRLPNDLAEDADGGAG